MSAHVAWLLWLTQRRAERPANPEAEAADWQAVAPEFRAYVRKVLRSAIKDDIFLGFPNEGSHLDAESDEWTRASARLAWRFWLFGRRKNAPADQTEEAAEWAEEASEYRSTFRNVLKSLEKKGIFILS